MYNESKVVISMIFESIYTPFGDHTIDVPPDKSISNRSILLNIIAQSGRAKIKNILLSEDTLATIAFAKRIGFDIKVDENKKTVSMKKGKLIKDIGTFDCKNSGTTVRHIMSIMCGLDIKGVLDGDSSLRKRPMQRITSFLKEMGADFKGGADFLPIEVRSSRLNRIDFTTDLASAQQKSSFILASLLAEGEKATFNFKVPSRDHTEIMLKEMGINLIYDQKDSYRQILIKDKRPSEMKDFTVPGDFSSAAFFIVLAILTPGMCLKIKDVNLNKSRTGLLDVLIQMGADIDIFQKKGSGEESGDIIIRHSSLKGVNINNKEIIPRMIDEFPVLALAMAFADSKSRVENVGELRVKESDRIEKIREILNFCGMELLAEKDRYEIDPARTKKPSEVVDTSGDHRIIMTAILAAIITKRKLKLDDISGINVSFPDFFKSLKEIGYEYKCSD
ncbi:MAG: 3-phosphoshikimate 1-carboxyvinyltransferase [Candidatus Muiribacterium halophilum]|uniref:3-phosphoshikimate 1-carboxyvinyltransferase n=1 Tax=Muiribacterium halophilum TaxID=2053465 RepID=A0A2N5ZKB3_MUIH1|nr:MAG: 3-phosphoshikimate 1-carboxyvinyltransferase [Candidatus Muirbacterium halophilum]